MAKVEDLRVKRTRKLITMAFFNLLRTKKFEKISIQEIADNAMINRATFYAHYADKQDLYDSLIESFFLDFSNILDESSLVDGHDVHVLEIEGILSRFYEFVRINPEVAQIVIDKSQDQVILQRFLQILTARYAELFEKLEVREQDVLIPNNFVINYITALLVGTLKWWGTDSQDMKPDDFAHLMIKLISNGHLTVLGVNINREK
ncbi:MULTISPECIES: TetR/AcrR family transcriptional regulator [unclassified Lactococcus]|uniref:TetR/AcrR family transcriptional regulator n=1 Tax=unclassified Lactococcus TaxID=2643510 RepID=UPI0011C6EAB6|nr:MULTISPECIES: TetR/AcrR family transcriptional regulator [unclassified Lactococcus]MQW23061.1 TetR family transcriptional regulator [Lactococcus sp. dk101]TXK44406.1 TetR/AcrR family transcriptional regulator [Lactococcus sp. dk310]TXK50216.1 TetR/AcrR family transcriptional regulator [Lactococcus sp. dk322]